MEAFGFYMDEFVFYMEAFGFYMDEFVFYMEAFGFYLDEFVFYMEAFGFYMDEFEFYMDAFGFYMDAFEFYMDAFGFYVPNSRHESLITFRQILFKNEKQSISVRPVTERKTVESNYITSRVTIFIPLRFALTRYGVQSGPIFF